jgi:hypothetical protein
MERTPLVFLSVPISQRAEIIPDTQEYGTEAQSPGLFKLARLLLRDKSSQDMNH